MEHIHHACTTPEAQLTKDTALLNARMNVLVKPKARVGSFAVRVPTGHDVNNTNIDRTLRTSLETSAQQARRNPVLLIVNLTSSQNNSAA
jgi:hypothetical protein